MPRKKKSDNNPVTFRATREGRYGAIRGATKTRYSLDSKRQIYVSNDDDIAGFDNDPAFERVKITQVKEDALSVDSTADQPKT